MKTVSVKCPDCGAALELEEGRTVYYCQYCGAKVFLDDEADRHVYVDEARIKEAEVKEKIRLKELELEVDKRNDEKKSKVFKIKASIVLAIIGITCFILNMLVHSTDVFETIAYGIVLIIILIWINDGIFKNK